MIPILYSKAGGHFPGRHLKSNFWEYQEQVQQVQAYSFRRDSMCNGPEHSLFCLRRRGGGQGKAHQEEARPGQEEERQEGAQGAPWERQPGRSCYPGTSPAFLKATPEAEDAGGFIPLYSSQHSNDVSIGISATRLCKANISEFPRHCSQCLPGISSQSSGFLAPFCIFQARLAVS